MSFKKISVVFIFVIVTFMLFGDEKVDRTLLLKIGDKNLKEKTMAVSAGKIYSARNGKSIAFSKMIKEMEKSRFVYVGENNNSLPMHQVQAKIIKALY